MVQAGGLAGADAILDAGVRAVTGFEEVQLPAGGVGGADVGADRRANQSVNVSRAKAGSGRRRSMPANFSRSARMGARLVRKFDIPGTRAPNAFSRAMRPNSRLRRGRPWAW